MNEDLILGIDCGGTHTDAALLAINEDNDYADLIASAKTNTLHDNLPASIIDVLSRLIKELPGEINLAQVKRVTLGTTLEVNALVQGKTDRVGLALSAGSGLNPEHFAIGDHVCIVPGGLDHRGVETGRLYTDILEQEAALWADQGVAAIACVGKFSPRNPEHEDMMARVAAKASGLPVTLGHTLSGRLNFPRRIATAYYNAAVGNIHQQFLNAVEKAFKDSGIDASLRLLKADGGAIPFSLSRREPVRSILSGPAASVMGVMALWDNASRDCSLLLDMGGTTTDIAMFLNGSPVLDRQGMLLEGRRTLVRSLASSSIGVGGDSLISRAKDGSIKVGPLREGPAMAFGGAKPTLLDALNFLDASTSAFDRGDVEASINGINRFAREHGNIEPGKLAALAVEDALNQINKAIYDLVENINAKPIYTLAALKSVRQARPRQACLVGGPSLCIQERMAKALGMPVEIAPNPQVANAIGAALTIPTATLEIYADTGKGELRAPSIQYVERINKNFSLDEAKDKAIELLELRLKAEGIENLNVEVIEADMFATLDDHGRGAKDMRVTAQVKPGIIARVKSQKQ